MLQKYPIFEGDKTNTKVYVVKKLIDIIKLLIFGFNVNIFGQNRLMHGRT